MRTIFLLSLFLLPFIGEAAGVNPYSRSVETVVFSPYGDTTLSKITLSDGTVWNAYVDFSADYSAEDFIKALKSIKTLALVPAVYLPSFFLSSKEISIETSLTQESLDSLPKLTQVEKETIPRGWFSPESFIATLALSDGASFKITTAKKEALEKVLSHWKIGDPILVTQYSLDVSKLTLINISALVPLSTEKLKRMIDYRRLHPRLGDIQILNPPATRNQP